MKQNPKENSSRRKFLSFGLLSGAGLVTQKVEAMAPGLVDDEKVTMLTASLTAAQNQIGQAEARAARAEAQLAQTSETVRSMEAKLKQAALSAASAENALLESGRERGRLSEQLDVLRQAARFPTANKAVSSVVESPTVASKPAPVQPSSAAVPSSPAPVKPATVPTEQSVTRAAGQAVPPPAAVKPAVLRRNTLSILKPGGNIK